MERKTRAESHVTDTLFTLGLFCVFAASAFVLVLIGIRVYQSTVTQLQDTYSTRTAVAYVAEKLRQHDVTGGVELSEVEGRSALRMTDSLGGEPYYTYIYSDGEYLCELTVRPETAPKLSLGERILAVQDFSIRDAGEGFFELNAAGSGGDNLRVLLHMRSAAG